MKYMIGGIVVLTGIAFIFCIVLAALLQEWRYLPLAVVLFVNVIAWIGLGVEVSDGK